MRRLSTRTAAGFGTLVVQVATPPPGTRFDGTFGFLALTSREGARWTRSFDWPAEDEVVLEDLPFGDYAVHVEPWSPAAMGLTRVVPGRIVVGVLPSRARAACKGPTGRRADAAALAIHRESADRAAANRVRR